jgi:hypothetical protein
VRQYDLEPGSRKKNSLTTGMKCVKAKNGISRYLCALSYIISFSLPMAEILIYLRRSEGISAPELKIASFQS